MFHHLRPALVMTLVLTVLTGLAYPLAITGIAQTVLPAEANGSLIRRDGAVVGSALIGQHFGAERYFWSRPSATSPDPYAANASSGSNLGPTATKLRDRVSTDIQTLKTTGIPGPLPGDAVTTSGSGLDPHISPEYAKLQIARVAKARGLPDATVAELVGKLTQSRTLGLIGEPRVNVLELNLALDALAK